METIETEMLWGALSSDVMEPLGAPAAVASVLLRPSSIPVELMEQMHALIPVEVLPKEGDTPGSLAARLSENQYLHPKYVLNNGNGSGKQTYVQLNSTQYAQPRRVRWGLPKEIQWPEGEDGEAHMLRFPVISTAILVLHWKLHAKLCRRLSINSPSFCGRRLSPSLLQTPPVHHQTIGSSASTIPPSRVLWEGIGTTSNPKILCLTTLARIHLCLQRQSMRKCRTQVS